MPPEQIEADITGRFERFFTLASNIEHIESRSLPGVSLIKIYFQPEADADSAVTNISNLAMANLRRLPPGTLPPVVLKFDASSLPVCLITLKGEGLTETELRDLGQYAVRNQVANVQGASVPQPFGGRYRQIMVYVDPVKLEAHQLSPMDVVRTVNASNLILPAGDARIGPFDYSLYTNSQADTVEEIARIPLKTNAAGAVFVGDIGTARDAAQIQTNIVRVDGQPSVYLPVLKQGGDTNTIAVVDGVKNAVSHLFNVPSALGTQVVFDQSQFVKNAIETLLHEGAIGLVLTSLMILVFLGSMRATLAVCLSIPLSALTTFMEAVALGNVRLSMRSTAVRVLSSWTSIASGLSIGREGPLIEFGGALGATMGRLFSSRLKQTRILVAAGTAAGFAAAYNTPFAAVLFVLETIVGIAAIEALLPVMAAVLLAVAITRAVAGGGPIYGARSFTLESPLDLLSFALLGALAALAALCFKAVLGALERWTATHPIPQPARAIMGGACVGGIAMFVPEVAGNGYEPLNVILDRQLAVSVVLALLVAKVAATSVSVASGVPGGIFTPMSTRLTISRSIGVLPTRSPMPSIVPCTRLAPASRAARLFIVPMPRSA